jgi:hemerythrin-like metal-binding protein
MALEIINENEVGDAASFKSGLVRLYDYADRHFRHEEQIIAFYGLPGFEQQTTQHEAFRNVLREYIEKAGAGKKLDISEMRSFILSWWINHINDIDSVSFAPSALAATVFLSADCWDEFAPFIRSTGHEDLDDDHREISGLIIQFKHMTEQGASTEEAIQLFDDIMAFANDHFSREEKLIKARSALLGKLHMDDHARFLTMLKSYREDIRFGRAHLSENIRRSLLFWWSTHINEFDFHTFHGDEH